MACKPYYYKYWGILMDVIQEYCETKTNSKHNKSLLHRYFSFIDIDPNKYVNDAEVNIYKDLRRYVAYLVSEELSPGTINNYFYKLLKFLRYNDIELSTAYEMRLKELIPDKVTISYSDILTQDELKAIMNLASTKMRAIITFLISSGVRIGELLQLQLDDIKDKNTPMRIYIPSIITKTKQPRDIFISLEAQECLESWLDIREHWLEHRNMTLIKNRNPNEDKVIFPVSYTSTHKSFINLLEKTGKAQQDRVTNRYVYSIHSLRKYFSTHMRKAMDWELVEMLLGHSQGVKGRYYKPSIDDIRKAYSDASYTIGIYHSGVPLSLVEQLKEEIKRRDNDLRDIEKNLGDVKRIQEIQNKIIYFEEMTKEPDLQSEYFKFDWKTVSNDKLADIGNDIENKLTDLKRKLREMQGLDK